MKLRLIVIGKSKSAGLKELEAEYLKRLNVLMPLQIVELKPMLSGTLTTQETQLREGEQLLSKIKADEFLVVLDESGDEHSSVEFAKLLSGWINRGKLTITFVIGGAYGVSQLVRDRADKILSLSQLTFPYQLARILVVEQLYRAVMLIKGKPYHKAN